MIYLREIRREDIPVMNKWRNDPELINNLLAPFRYINIEVDYKWFEDYMQARNNAIRCVIVDTEDETCILGLVTLMDINYIHRSAEAHIVLDEKSRGKGIGAFAIKEMLKHAFQNMNLNRVEFEVLENNNRSMKHCEKLGFVIEGRKRQAVYKNGKYVDTVILSILKEEFLNRFGERNLIE